MLLRFFPKPGVGYRKKTPEQRREMKMKRRTNRVAQCQTIRKKRIHLKKSNSRNPLSIEKLVVIVITRGTAQGCAESSKDRQM